MFVWGIFQAAHFSGDCISKNILRLPSSTVKLRDSFAVVLAFAGESIRFCAGETCRYFISDPMTQTVQQYFCKLVE